MFGQNEILCSQPIDMDQHAIKNVKSPVNKFGVVNKAYVDRTKFKSATGTIPNTDSQIIHSSCFPMRKVL